VDDPEAGIEAAASGLIDDNAMGAGLVEVRARLHHEPQEVDRLCSL